MRFTHLHTNLLLALSLVVLVSGCNSKGYQNMTARYNGYFYADQRLEEVNQAIEDGYEYNYNDILKIYPEIDSGTVNANKSKLEDAFKKASRVIEWHKTSDWVDDSYLIIGKIRHLQAEFAFAVATLQYINQTSEDPDARHAALIALMRTYMDAGDTDNAEQVENYLDLEELSEANMADFKITSAYFDQREGDMESMKKNLVEVSDLIKNKNERSRINFILGQVFQEEGANDIAYEFYKASLAGAPPYELDFHARLNMQQVAPFGSGSQANKIREVYAKLLKDGKNKEYQDKIYYEMGEFERKQTRYDQALANYLQAVGVEQPSPRQKALAFLRAGELNYEIYERFELASKYYDSALMTLPEDVEGYEAIKKRQTVLADFSKQLKIISVNDSLLSLASMNPVSLDAFLDIYLDEKEAEAQEKEKAEQRAQRTNTGVNIVDSGTSNFGAGGPNSGEWYFYNDAAMSQGELQFRRQWGDRPLEDNWRRSIKDAVRSDEQEVDTDDPNVTASVDDEPATELPDARKAEKAKLLATIPTTPEAQTKAHEEIQEAYFNLGGIYRLGLEKIPQSADAYQTLIEKYPDTVYKLNALFALYSIYQPTDAGRAQTYKDQIIREFPDSLIAKILIDPQYLEKKEARSRRLQGIYASAYDAYEAGDYIQADQIIRNALASFEDVDFLPTVELFAAILKSRTESLASYEAALKAFTQKYPEGPLFEEAKTRLDALNEASPNAPKDEEFLYSEDFRQLHIVAVAFNTKLNDTDKLRQAIDDYNKSNFEKARLNTGYLEFDATTNTGVVFMSPFQTKAAAENYHRLFKQQVSTFLEVDDSNFNNFVISRDNFTTLFDEKDLETYLKFYKRFYK